MIADPKSMGWFTGKFAGFSLYFMGKSTSTNPDPQIIELDDGKIYRKALYLMVKTMVSCRFSLQPIQ